MCFFTRTNRSLNKQNKGHKLERFLLVFSFFLPLLEAAAGQSRRQTRFVLGELR